MFHEDRTVMDGIPGFRPFVHLGPLHGLPKKPEKDYEVEIQSSRNLQAFIKLFMAGHSFVLTLKAELEIILVKKKTTTTFASPLQWSRNYFHLFF